MIVIVIGGALTLLYGLVLGPPLADRDPLVKASASLGFALILLGFMQWRWTADVRSLTLPTNDWQYTKGWLRINWTQAIGIIFPVALTAATVLFLNRTKIGTAMRALADDRDNTVAAGRARATRRGDRLVRIGSRLRAVGSAARHARVDGDRRRSPSRSRSRRWRRR